jgi:hypothetical protein
MSAVTNIDMSSWLVDCRLSSGGPDGQRGPRHEEHEGTEALPCAPSGVMEERLTLVKAGTLMGVTARLVRRLIEWVEQDSDQGLVHRGQSRSRPRC